MEVNMRYAISADGDFVSPHFGRCPSFMILDIEDNAVIKKEVLNNPGHRTGYIPEFLHQKDVNCIICGGIGQSAIGFLQQYGIETIVGIEGKISDVIDKLVKGKLLSGKSLCQPESGKNYGIGKKCDHEEGD